MSLARDTALVLRSHTGTLAEHGIRLDKNDARLHSHDGKLDEVNGYLAMLDRKEQRIIESIDQLRVVVTAQFREIREALRMGQNGSR